MIRSGQPEIPARITQHENDRLERRKQRIKAAISRLDGLIQQDPGNAWLYVHRGTLRGHRCVFEDAAYRNSLAWLPDFDAAVDRAPDDPWILCWRAIECYGRRQRGSQVIADVERAIAADPPYDEARQFLEQERGYIQGF